MNTMQRMRMSHDHDVEDEEVEQDKVSQEKQLSLWCGT